MQKIKENQELYFIKYMSPFILVMGISIVFLFYSYNVKIEKVQRWIGFFSSVAFDVYIMHCHPYAIDYLIKDSFKWIANIPLLLIPFVVVGIAIIGYIGMALIGKLRIIFFEKAKINIGCKKLASILDKILYSDFSESM